jgi:hypothetical protein
MPVIEAQYASILVPHDRRHISQIRTLSEPAVMPVSALGSSSSAWHQAVAALIGWRVPGGRSPGFGMLTDRDWIASAQI